MRIPEEVRERTDILDSVGNTTAAIGKGFAIASAALTALALFAAYVPMAGILDGINIFKAKVLSALFIGGMIPVVFSALAMNSVGKAAMDMVKEVRRQFREIPGIMEGTGKNPNMRSALKFLPRLRFEKCFCLVHLPLLCQFSLVSLWVLRH